MYNGEIKIIYDIKRDDKYIQIFGDDFVRNNRDKCKMIIENKEYEIAEKYNVNNNNNNKLNIILKGINNVTDMGRMFYECKSLSSLPDISTWNTNNVTNMQSLFKECNSLLSLPDISKWNTNNVTNMISMFYGCSNIIISKVIKIKFNL